MCLQREGSLTAHISYGRICQEAEAERVLIRRLHEVTALDLNQEEGRPRHASVPYGWLARITATQSETADRWEIRDDLQVWSTY